MWVNCPNAWGASSSTSTWRAWNARRRWGRGFPRRWSTLQQAKKILVIDGCASHCVAKMLQKVGVEGYHHLELGELGFAKGHAPVTEENIHRAAEVARVLFES